MPKHVPLLLTLVMSGGLCAQSYIDALMTMHRRLDHNNQWQATYQGLNSTVSSSERVVWARARDCSAQQERMAAMVTTGQQPADEKGKVNLHTWPCLKLHT